jgi:hypothetical protein
MKFTYKNKSLIVSAMREAKKEIWRYIDFQKSVDKFSWNIDKRRFSFKNYTREEYPYLNIQIIKEPIDLLDELCKSKSKYVDFEELISDLNWIKTYFKEKKWSSVCRWLSNTESTLHRDFSDYMDEISALPSNPFKKKKENS